MSELPSKAEVDPRSCDVAKVPILLQKSGMMGSWRLELFLN
jgi:hypothetical protein